METELTRDCKATLIPQGSETTLSAGTSVFVTQTLGGNVTVRVGPNLLRIDQANLDALGDVDLQPNQEEEAASGGDEAFSEAVVWGALKRCFDPEIPVNIVDLGLIYDLRIEELDSGKKEVFIKMTLTAQGCGMGPVIAQDAKTHVEQIDEVERATVDIVWDPVWNPQMISAEGRKILGIE